MEVTLRGLDELERALMAAPAEIARAARNAVNDTAREVQRGFRGTLGEKFSLTRRPFVERQVYLTPATKQNLAATVSIQGPGGGESFLTKFEADRTKHPRRSSTLAVPAREIRERGGHVQRGLGLKSFLPLATIGGTYQKFARRKGRLVPGKVISTNTRRVGKRGTFLITLPSGTQALARRPRGGSLELLWYFMPQTPIPTSLRFEADAMRIAEKVFPSILDDAISHALRRAGLL